MMREGSKITVSASARSAIAPSPQTRQPAKRAFSPRCFTPTGINEAGPSEINPPRFQRSMFSQRRILKSHKAMVEMGRSRWAVAVVMALAATALLATVAIQNMEVS